VIMLQTKLDAFVTPPTGLNTITLEYSRVEMLQ